MAKCAIRWLFFDLGNTLIDESKPTTARGQQLVEALGRHGCGIGVADLYNALEQASREFAPRLIVRALELLEPRVDVRAILAEVTYDKALERPYPGTPALLGELARDYAIGIIANQSVGTAARLKSFGLLEYVSVCLSSAEEGLAKPDPEFFNRALARASCSAEEAVMIGDRLDNDIAPANALGWRTIRVLQGFARVQIPRTDLEIPDYVIPSIEKIRPLLDGIAEWRDASDLERSF